MKINTENEVDKFSRRWILILISVGPDVLIWEKKQIEH